ncbi:MAG TPA: hypothetical protein VKU77_17705 [Streptosporangiaceae bacterium]|nr:hypothetical protein [Streptosporangiaceae bacterium]
MHKTALRDAITSADQAIMTRVRTAQSPVLDRAGDPAIVLRKRRDPLLVYRPES